jgi:hypothetical protein
MHDAWVERIKKIPRNYPTLTEAQWLEAVRHFNGCALCDDESVDTRGYFIPFVRGGRYCNWNIIPVCYKCALKARALPNYFLWDRPKDLLKIIDYLEERIDEALAKSTEGV